MATLYALNNVYMDLVAQLEEAQDEQTASEIMAKLDTASGEIDAKASVYAKIVQNKIGEAEMYKEEIKRLTGLKKAAENTADRLKAYLKGVMEATGKNEIQTDIGKWRLQLNPYSVEILDKDKIDKEWLIEQEPTIDKQGLLKHFKATGEIPEGVSFKQEMGLRFK